MRILMILMAFMPLFASGQYGKRKPKTSVARGTLYGYYGYNRSWYSKSKIGFVGPGYEFDLSGSKATDSPIPFDPSIHLNPMRTTLAQYNVRLGYYIRNHFAISLGYDKMKYVFDNSNPVLLSGTVNPGVDQETNWSGNYTNASVSPDSDKFLYRNAGGMNYIRLEGTRSDQWFAIGSEQQFIFSTHIGAGLGALMTENTFRFAGMTDINTKGLSGYALSLHGGLRFEFFKHFFIQSNISGGFMHQTHVKTRLNELNAYARQKFGFFQFDTNLGFLLYIRPTNDCNSCPVW
ncbi:MAG: hypothetical protein ACK46O_12540 [Flavobacteriia bacterium]|jgi:hypothetical protein